MQLAHHIKLAQKRRSFEGRFWVTQHCIGWLSSSANQATLFHGATNMPSAVLVHLEDSTSIKSSKVVHKIAVGLTDQPAALAEGALPLPPLPALICCCGGGGSIMPGIIGTIMQP